MDRRNVLACLAAVASSGVAAPFAHATTEPLGKDVIPPYDTRDNFVHWMAANRGEDPNFLAQRWDRYQVLLERKDVWETKNIRGFLLTPREEFVTKENASRTYVWHYLDIGYGVTITGPHTVAKMTSTLDISDTDKVLEIGTGSGYQSAYLSNLTNHVWTIEIIPALAARTRRIYDGLIQRGYKEYASITTKNADGYYGWEEFAPFDKIIVTCGIDHVPPALLRQLKPGGMMVIPIGPPGAQHVLKIVTAQASDGVINVPSSRLQSGKAESLRARITTKVFENVKAKSCRQHLVKRCAGCHIFGADKFAERPDERYKRFYQTIPNGACPFPLADAIPSRRAGWCTHSPHGGRVPGFHPRIAASRSSIFCAFFSDPRAVLNLAAAAVSFRRLLL